MRADTDSFELKNKSASKDPRYTVEIAFDPANTDLHYFTSHADSATPAGATVTSGVIKGLSGTSQSVSPEKALATIGTISFDVVDSGDAVRSLQYTKLQFGKGLRGMRVRVYVGFDGLAWADYSLIQTQIIESVSYSKGAYSFKCSDIQREARKNVFDFAETTLSASVGISDTTVNVYNTSDFEALEHSSGFSDAPSQTVFYFKIKDEIIRATGKTSTSFTGCTRGVLNTKAAVHNIDSSAATDRRTKLEEYVYLELPASKLIYAILTGDLLGQSTTLPASWHLGISTSYVRQSDFSDVGVDWYDASNDANGVVLRFEGLGKQDGKKFIEQEILLLLGAFSPVYSDGALGLKRMVSVLSKSGYVTQLDESNVVSHSALTHDMPAIFNYIEIQWNWDDTKERFTRRNSLVDATSLAVNGQSKKLDFKFRGLHGSRSSTETIGERFNAFRDRYTGPPLRMSVVALPSMNVLEVGDTVRVNLDDINDYNTDASLDRTFEVQNVAVNWVTGNVSLKLFGSSQAADAIAQTVASSVIPDAFYSSSGNNLSTYVGGGYDAGTDYTLTGSVGHIISDCQLTGNASLTNAAAIYYHDGDLTIDAGVTVTITDNVQLRVKGHLTINGTINGVGQGLAGAAKRTGDSVSTSNQSYYNNKTLGSSGFLGSTKSGGGWLLPLGGNAVYSSADGWLSVAQNQVAPQLNLNVLAGSVTGIPSEIRGSSGATGHTMFNVPSGYSVAGGAGGNGGAGLFVVSRGASFGTSGAINVSGTGGGTGDFGGSTGLNSGIPFYYAGSGAGGAPGAVYFVLDGVSVNVPLLATITARFGTTPVSGNSMGAPNASLSVVRAAGTPLYSFYKGIGYPPTDLSGNNGAARIQFVIGAETPEEDADSGVIDSVTGLAASSGTAELLLNEDGTVTPRVKLSWTASLDPRVIGAEIQYKKSADSIWLSAPPVIGEIETYIASVVSGVAYDFRVRAADDVRNASEWATVSSHTIAGKSALPSDVTGFTVLQNGGIAVFKWAAVTDADYSGADIRYGPQTGGDYASATPLTQITKGTNVSSADVPDGDWRFYIKAVDTSGNYSATAATKDVTFVSDYDVITTVAEHPLFGGTLTNMIRHWTGVLVPDSQNLASADGWDTFDVFVINPYAICSYEGAEIDMSFDDTIRVWADITSTLGPGESGIANPQFQIDYRLDAGSYDGFEDWSIGGVIARYVKPKIEIDTSTGVYFISTFSPTVDVVEYTQRGSNITVGASGTTVTFAKEFHSVPAFVSVQVQGATALYPTRDNITATGFDFHIFDSSGSEVGGTGDYEATGV